VVGGAAALFACLAVHVCARPVASIAPCLLAIGIGEPLFSETETLKALLQGLGLMVSAISGERQTFLDE